jgi:hypothetical protein
LSEDRQGKLQGVIPELDISMIQCEVARHEPPMARFWWYVTTAAHSRSDLSWEKGKSERFWNHYQVRQAPLSAGNPSSPPRSAGSVTPRTARARVCHTNHTAHSAARWRSRAALIGQLQGVIAAGATKWEGTEHILVQRGSGAQSQAMVMMLKVVVVLVLQYWGGGGGEYEMGGMQMIKM